ncbi:alpha/beta fold hydrolase [Alsobacter sp. SYSU M60028]|uniref:Alpha/beta fold hydrolase n=1 Tax=Alsobacter ponti TaxID=2962936 RepID=A0ABT1L948_9HYPH|nr:alpha/beta fold hydrolase [Alsobacter ponti]MCP8937616.1 alpha/beta fold hydrolase [Alsobacter ponti]
MTARLTIGVLGELQVTRGEDVVQLPPSRKTRALLAFLAVAGRPQRRERLCEMFWEVPDDPRGALRWSLSKIRQVLNGDGRDRVMADRNTVQLDFGDIEVDFSELAALKPDDVAALPTDRLCTLADLFRGEFLEDLSFPRCPDFEAWRTFHADAIGVLRLRVLRTLVERLADDPERALAFAHRLHMLDPDDAVLAARVEELAEAARDRGRRPAAVTVAAPPPEPPAPSARPEEAAPLPAVDKEQTIRFCTAGDGVRIAYAVSGEGPPIVRAAHWMSHVQHDWRSPVWRHWMEELSRENRLIRYDERGNGLSDWNVADISFEAMVSDLASVVDAAGLERFTLLGVSQSCAVSVAYAIRHPERVAGLILYGGYVRGWRKRGDPGEIATREALATLMRAGWGQNNPIFRQLFTARFIPGASPDQIASFDELQRMTVSPENAWRLQSMFADIDVTALLGRVTAPTLVLHGARDQVAPFESGRALATGIPNARFVALDTANHILSGDEPAFHTFLREVRGFTAAVNAAPARPAATTEGRRQVTVLTAEVVNPDSLLDFTDPEEAELTPLRERSRAIVAAHGGTVVGAGPNEITVAFGAETATEDHALQACRAALAMQAAFEALADSTMTLRIGIDSGEAVVRARRDGERGRPEVSGSPVQVARRLVHALQRGVIAVTDRARHAVGGYARLTRLEHAACPAFPEDWAVFELVAERSGTSRWQLRARAVDNRLVGREAEMRALRDLARHVRGGAGQAVALTGEAGFGKSRLAHEFLASEDLADFAKVECGALELDGDSPWGLMKKLLRSLFGVDRNADAEAATRGIAAVLEDRAADLLSPLLFVLDLPVPDPSWNALSAPARARRVEDAALASLSAVAARAPVALLIEDLHWADAQSLAAVRRILAWVAGEKVLALATSRADPEMSWLGDGHVTRIALQPLDPATALAFATSILGDDPSVAPLARAIAERTGGVPLFIEEVIGEMAQSGRLAGRAGAYTARGDVDALVVPMSVQSVIAARLGKLDEQDRRILQASSVIGREIRPDLLARLAGLDEATVERRLEALVDEGFLVERASGPARHWAFRHALIQEVVHGGLLAERRRDLNARLVEAMEQTAAGDAFVERLAEHALRAEAWDKAAHYLVRAARKALARSAHGTALTFAERGLEAVARLPESQDRHRLELDLQKARGLAWMAARGWGSPEVGQACARAEELCNLLDDTSELYVVLRGRAQYYMIGGQPRAARDVTLRCQELSRGTNDEGLVIETHHMEWTNGLFMGEYDTAIDSAERSRAIYRPESHHGLTYLYSGHDPGVCCRCFAGLAYWQQGKLLPADEACREAVDLAEKLAHPLTTAIAYWGMSYLHLFRSEPARCLEWAERVVDLCDEFSLPLLRSQGRFQAGWAMAHLGDARAGLAAMSEGVEAIRATGAEMGLPYFLALMAETVARTGDQGRALALVEEALASARRNGARFQFSEFLRIKAEILAGSGAAPEEVEALLRSAIRSAGRQHASVGELRAATQLARHLARHRRHAEARDTLAPYSGLIGQLAGTAESHEARGLL